MAQVLSNGAVGLIFFAAYAILLVSNWRWRLGLLALQYLGVMGLVLMSWPLEIAVVKLVAGWMAAAVLMISFVNLPSPAGRQPPGHLPGLLFRGLVAVLVGLSVYSLQPVALRWFINAAPQQALGGLLMIGLGLLQLGLSLTGIRTIVGLLTVISGFEVLYATLEASVLMTGLLAVLHIGIAFVGAYLLFSFHLEGTQ